MKEGSRRGGIGILRFDPRLVAALGMVAGLAIMILGLFTHGVVSLNGKEMFTYGPISMFAVVVGAMLFAGSFVLIILTTGSFEPFARPMPRPPDREKSSGGPTRMAEPSLAKDGESGHPALPDLDVGLILRLLGGDERTVFRTIADSGGAMFQKDLVNKTKMSDAKVSRVLDRLEAKDLVVRERQGMTNRVAIKGR